MKIEPISLKEKFKRFDDHWSPKIIGEMNDYQFKLAKVKGDFVWHHHQETDETFFVISGKLNIELKDTKIKLNEGEMVIIPKGVEHRPYSKDECLIMLIEPKNVKNTGNIKNELTVEKETWI